MFVSGIALLVAGCSPRFNTSSVSQSKWVTPTLVFATPPSNNPATGVAFPQQPVVAIQDGSGGLLSNRTDPITLTLYTDGACTVAAVPALSYTPVSTVAGVASFTDVKYGNVGTFYLGASTPALTPICYGPLAIGVGPPSQLVFTVQPSNAQGGQGISPAVQVSIEDAGGNVVSTSSANVTLTIGTNPSAGTLSGTVTVAASLGVASFPGISIDKKGVGYTLVASALALNKTSNAFNITTNLPSKLAYTTNPSASATAGSPFAQQPVVAIEDNLGSITSYRTDSIALTMYTDNLCTSATGTAVTYTPVGTVAGSATFTDAAYKIAGTGYYLGASAAGLTNACFGPITINAGAANKLAFTVQPSNAMGGQTISPAIQVSVQDQYGNLISGSTASISVAIGTNPGAGTLSGTTPVSAVAGVATLNNLSINNQGTGYTLTASSAGLTSATSNAFNITTNSPSKLVYTTNPSSSVTAGVAFAQQPVVAIEDSLGNTMTYRTDAIALTLYTGFGCVTAAGTNVTYTPPATTNGVATYTDVKYSSTVGLYYLGASAAGLTSACYGPISVGAGALSQYVFTQIVGSPIVNAPTSSQTKVTAEDAYGNTVTTASAPVTLSAYTDNLCAVAAAGTLSFGGGNPQTPASGVATYTNYKYTKPESVYLKASDGTYTGCSNVINNKAKIKVTAGPATGTAGTCTGPFTISPVDYNNVAVAFSAAKTINYEAVNGNDNNMSEPGVSFYWGTDPTCTTPKTSFSLPSGNSSATFYMISTRADVMGLEGYNNGDPNISSSNLYVSFYNTTISAAAASKIKVTGPTWLSSGVCTSAYTVTLLDQYNNVAKASGAVQVNLTSVPVTFYSGAGCVSSTGNIIVANATSSNVFYASNSTAGNFTINAADNAGLLTADNFNANVTGAPPTLQISASGDHTCELNGTTVSCWGANSSGQLGNGNTTDQLAPVFPAGLPAISQIATGDSTTCARAGSGAAYCWGAGGSGQIGNGTSSSIHNTPVQVKDPPGTGTLTGVTDITVGTTACAVSGGNVYCWGKNNHGQVGNGTTVNATLPTKVLGVGGVGFLSNIVQVRAASGGFHVCAVDNTGNAYCWGYNSGGQLGNGNTTDSSTPVLVSGGLNITSIAVAGNNTCAVTAGGNAYCWGTGDQGQLGNGGVTGSNVPVKVKDPPGTGFLSNVQKIAVGGLDSSADGYACATTSTGVYCWGNNALGQLANGAFGGTSSLPVQPAGYTAGNYSDLSAGYGRVCLGQGTSYWSWGYNELGILGNGSITNYSSPMTLFSLK